MSIQIFGVPISRGVAIGKAVLVAAGPVDVPHHLVEASAVESEAQRLRQACRRVASELDDLQAELPADAPAELGALLDMHAMLVRDPHLVEAACRWITERRYNASWAMAAQLEVLARQFDEMEDAYLRDRKVDLEHVVTRILAALAATRYVAERSSQGGVHSEAAQARAQAGDDPLVLVATDVAPADMLAFRRSAFCGFVTDLGGQASHTAIVARSMDIPAVVGARDASRIARQDDWVIIDGEQGLIIVDPPQIVLEEYRFRQRESVLEQQRLARLRHTPAITLDGEAISLQANIELPSDAPMALEVGAVGVGLFRTEFLFMNRGGQLPAEDEQYEAYREVVIGMRGLPVTIRTVDVGADKPLDRSSSGELRADHALNPALGLRAIRWSLADPPMFRQQLRAILRAAAHGPVRLLIPMVTHVAELTAVQSHLARARAQLAESAREFGHPQIGVMVEVPAAALSIRRLLPLLDFVSIGTNDLIQYTLAIDRADDAVSHLYDPWHPAVLQLIRDTIQACVDQKKQVSVCGEIAADPTFAALLLAMGLREFSMHPSSIAAVKQVILRADTRRLASRVHEVLSAHDPSRAAKDAWGLLTGRADAP